jgi:Ni,Fe-hydrogenase III large subunit
LPAYLARLTDEHLSARRAVEQGLEPAHRLQLDAEDWGAAGRIAADMGLRHAGVWADHLGSTRTGDAGPVIRVHACLERDGDHLLLETEVPEEQPILESHTPAFPGVNRLERHAHDLVGVRFEHHPDGRRWTRHQAWPEGHFPLRPSAATHAHAPRRTPADVSYPFVRTSGNGVYEIPVGPVHAGIIEPGHFRFHAAGEQVLALEERLGYVHRGIERLAVGRDSVGLLRLAGRVSGDSTVAYAWAAAQAIERAAGCTPPPRALYLRAVMAERERIANHLGDIGAICNDVGFAFANAQCARLRERWQRCNAAAFGHRLIMDSLVPGGVVRDLDDVAIQTLRLDQAALLREIVPVFAIIEDHPPLDDRLIETGILSTADARALGCTGYVGKASGLAFDLRRDSPYPPYDRLEVDVPVESAGDVAARFRVRMHEVRASLRLLEQLLDDLPAGEIVAAARPAADSVGLGLVEGWRGEILSFVRFDREGRLARYFPRDPSWFTWPALERLIAGNIVPDFPVCNKSVNGSYAGVDL